MCTCNNCNEITLFKGTNGVGVSSTVNNEDGTFTIYYTDGTSFTSVNLTGPEGEQGIAGTNAYKFVHEETSVFDDDTITITRQALEYCSLLPPACSTDPEFIDKVCDLHVRLYYLSSGIWYSIPEKPFGGVGQGYELIINATTGNLTITLSIAPVDPAVTVRVVILA